MTALATVQVVAAYFFVLLDPHVLNPLQLVKQHQTTLACLLYVTHTFAAWEQHIIEKRSETYMAFQEAGVGIVVAIYFVECAWCARNTVRFSDVCHRLITE